MPRKDWSGEQVDDILATLLSNPNLVPRSPLKVGSFVKRFGEWHSNKKPYCDFFYCSLWKPGLSSIHIHYKSMEPPYTTTSVHRDWLLHRGKNLHIRRLDVQALCFVTSTCYPNTNIYLCFMSKILNHDGTRAPEIGVEYPDLPWAPSRPHSGGDPLFDQLKATITTHAIRDRQREGRFCNNYLSLYKVLPFWRGGNLITEALINTRSLSRTWLEGRSTMRQRMDMSGMITAPDSWTCPMES